MARNVEIKARTADWEGQLERARQLASAVEELSQEDTFFACASGRLKLRQFPGGEGHLIFYRRPDQQAPKLSHYDVAPVHDAADVRQLLALALGEQATVRKQRIVLHCGQTRIHFDDVVGLGRFIELEIVLRPDQPESEGVAIAHALMAKLDIRPQDLVAGAYVDLMEGTA